LWPRGGRKVKQKAANPNDRSNGESTLEPTLDPAPETLGHPATTKICSSKESVMRLKTWLVCIFAVLSLAVQSASAEDCPAKSTMMDDIIAVLNDAPGCERAMKIFEACEYGTSGDVRFGAVVEKKCESDFLARLTEPQKLTYRREMRLCDSKYRNKEGTMYRSFTAFCRAEVAQRYSRRAQARRSSPAH
jgi:hypothetical protein